VTYLLSRKKSSRANEEAITTVGMKLLAFSKDSKKSLEMGCEKIELDQQERRVLINLKGRILPRGRVKNPVEVKATRGIEENDFNYFLLQENVQIVTEGIVLEGDEFFLENKKVLKTSFPVRISGEKISGDVNEGLEFHFDLNEFKFFNFAGTVNSAGKEAKIKSRLCWIIDKDKKILLEKESNLNFNGITIGAEIILLFFDQDFKRIVEIKCWKGTKLELNLNANSTALISSDHISLQFNEQNELSMVNAIGLEEIELNEPGKLNLFRGDKCSLFFEKQKLSKLELVNNCFIDFCSSQEKIQLEGNEFFADFNTAGRLRQIVSSKYTRFSVGDVSGSTNDFKFLNDILNLSNRAKIVTKELFVFSERVVFNTLNNNLHAEQDVKVELKSVSRGTIFSDSVLMVKANQFDFEHKNEQAEFLGNVKLFQDELELNARKMLFIGNENAEGEDVELSFKSKNRLIENLSGKKMSFNQKNSLIVVNGDAHYNSENCSLKAKEMEIRLSDRRVKQIKCQKSVSFIDPEYQASAEFFFWDLRKEILLLQRNVKIKQLNGTIVNGENVEIDLKEKKIKIVDNNRSNVILEEFIK